MKFIDPRVPQRVLYDGGKIPCIGMGHLIRGQVLLWPRAKGWEDLWDLDETITK